MNAPRSRRLPRLWSALLSAATLLWGLAPPAHARGPESVTVDVHIPAASKLLLIDFVPAPMPPDQPAAALPDWQALGLQPEDIGRTGAWYSRHLALIRDTGFDGLIYRDDDRPVSNAFLRALEEHDLTATVFIDLSRVPPAMPEGASPPLRRHAATVLAPVLRFFRALPDDRRPAIHDGRLPVFFSGLPPGVDKLPWRLRDLFFAELVQQVEYHLHTPVRLYWLDPVPLPVMEAVPRFSEIRAVNETIEGPNPPMTDALSVNLFTDERALAEAGLVARPLVRYDLRPVRQALWLARQRQCGLVRFTGWNAWTDGANIAPDTVWADRKMEIARAFLGRVREPAEPLLPDRLVRIGIPPEEPGARFQWNLAGVLFPFSDMTWRDTTAPVTAERYALVRDGGELLSFVVDPASTHYNNAKEPANIFRVLLTSDAPPEWEIPETDLPLPFAFFPSMGALEGLTPIPAPAFIVQSATAPVAIPDPLRKRNATLRLPGTAPSGIALLNNEPHHAPPGSAIEVRRIDLDGSTN